MAQSMGLRTSRGVFAGLSGVTVSVNLEIIRTRQRGRSDRKQRHLSVEVTTLTNLAVSSSCVEHLNRNDGSHVKSMGIA